MQTENQGLHDENQNESFLNLLEKDEFDSQILNNIQDESSQIVYQSLIKQIGYSVIDLKKIEAEFKENINHLDWNQIENILNELTEIQKGEQAFQMLDFSIEYYNEQNQKGPKNFLDRAVKHKFKLLMEQKKYDQAIGCMNQIHSRKIKVDYNTYCFFGDKLFENNKFEEAIKAYEIMFEQKFQLLTHFKIGNVLCFQRKFTEAIEQYDLYLGTKKLEQVEIFKQSPHVCLSYLVTQCQNNSDQNAQECVQILNNKGKWACLLIGFALLGLNKINEAIQVFNQAIAKNCKFDEANYNLSIALKIQNNNRNATKNEVEARPVGFDLKEFKKYNYYADEKFYEAQALMNQKKYQEAKIAYFQALKFKPQYVNEIFKQCETLHSYGNSRAALEWLKEIINNGFFPQKVFDLQIKVSLSELDKLIQQNQLEQALDLLLQVWNVDSLQFERASRSHNWFLQIGHKLMQNQNFEKAIQTFDYYQSLHENSEDINKDIYYHKLNALYLMNKYDEARELIELLKKKGFFSSNIQTIEDEIKEVMKQKENREAIHREISAEPLEQQSRIQEAKQEQDNVVNIVGVDQINNNFSPLINRNSLNLQRKNLDAQKYIEKIRKGTFSFHEVLHLSDKQQFQR